MIILLRDPKTRKLCVCVCVLKLENARQKDFRKVEQTDPIQTNNNSEPFHILYAACIVICSYFNNNNNI